MRQHLDLLASLPFRPFALFGISMPASDPTHGTAATNWHASITDALRSATTGPCLITPAGSSKLFVLMENTGDIMAGHLARLLRSCLLARTHYLKPSPVVVAISVGEQGAATESLLAFFHDAVSKAVQAKSARISLHQYAPLPAFTDKLASTNERGHVCAVQKPIFQPTGTEDDRLVYCPDCGSVDILNVNGLPVSPDSLVTSSVSTGTN